MAITGADARQAGTTPPFLPPRLVNATGGNIGKDGLAVVAVEGQPGRIDWGGHRLTVQYDFRFTEFGISAIDRMRMCGTTRSDSARMRLESAVIRLNTRGKQCPGKRILFPLRHRGIHFVNKLPSLTWT